MFTRPAAVSAQVVANIHDPSKGRMNCLGRTETFERQPADFYAEGLGSTRSGRL